MKKTTTGKTNPQRMFAMAMAMVVSTAPATAFAEETADGNDGTSQEATGTNASSNEPKVTITVTKNEDGSETKETKSESMDTDGTKTETIEKMTTKETTEENGKGGTVTTVNSEREYQETKTQPTQREPGTDEGGADGETPAEGNTETGYVEGSAASQFEEGKTTDVTTTTEGSEISSDTTVTDSKGRVVEESGHSSGSEHTTTTETVTDKYIEDRDELEKDQYMEGEAQTLVDEKSGFDNDGSVDTTTTSTPIDPGYAGKLTITLTPGGKDSDTKTVDEGRLYEELLAEDRPESGETKGTPQVEDVTDGEGNKIGTKTTTTDEKTNVADKKNAAGHVVGYEITKTTTTTVVTETRACDTNSTDPVVETGETTTTTAAPVETISLPERPAAGESKNAAGETTTTTVEDMTDEAGNVVGYSVTTVTKDASGKEIGRKEEALWGKKTVTVTTTETLETTTTKTEYITTTTTITDITEGKTVNGTWIESMARQAEGEMSKVTEDSGHGSQTMRSLPTDVQALIAHFNENDLREDPAAKAVNNTTDGKIQYIGHAVDSDYYIYRYNGAGWGNLSNAIYILKDDAGNTFFGYCVDMATNANRGTVYEIGNIEDQEYYQGSSIADAEAHIRAIALNGFWGTERGTGSITEIRRMLVRDHGWSEERAATLTEGQALTATQAAIWAYGRSDGNRRVHEDVVKSRYDGNITADEMKNIQDLYAALLGKTAPAEKPTNILDAGDILGSQITIGTKAEHHAKNADDNADNDVFNAGVSFTVAIVPTDKDRLRVIVKQDGKEIGSMELTAANGTQDGKGNTTYTMNNLQLQENLSINLSLDGTQHLKQGVYLYTATVDGVPSYTASQTFVGVGEGTHSVALDVSMKFDVIDETAVQKNSSGRGSRSRRDKKVTQTTDTETDREVVALMEITTVTVTEHSREWSGEYKEEFKYNDKKDKDPEEKEEKKDEENKNNSNAYTEEYIFDEDVPLAELPDVELPMGDIILEDVPKTNDMSAQWLAMSGFSGIGLAGLFGRRRKK